MSEDFKQPSAFKDVPTVSGTPDCPDPTTPPAGTEESLLEKAINVGREIAEANYQWSYSVITPIKNYFFSRRKK